MKIYLNSISILKAISFPIQQSVVRDICISCCDCLHSLRESAAGAEVELLSRVLSDPLLISVLFRDLRHGSQISVKDNLSAKREVPFLADVTFFARLLPPSCISCLKDLFRDWRRAFTQFILHQHPLGQSSFHGHFSLLQVKPSPFSRTRNPKDVSWTLSS